MRGILRKLTRREDNALLASDRKPIRERKNKIIITEKEERQFEELKRELSVGERELTLSLCSVLCHPCARTSCMFFLDFPGKFIV